jgi:hypothetical protein
MAILAQARCALLVRVLEELGPVEVSSTHAVSEYSFQTRLQGILVMVLQVELEYVFQGHVMVLEITIC